MHEGLAGFPVLCVMSTEGMLCADCNCSNHESIADLLAVKAHVQLADDCSLIEANKGTRFLEPVVIAFVLEYSKPSTMDPQQN